jgi:hypothetical protein
MRWLLLLLMVTPAFAQHNHERHHNDYQAWQSLKTPNCCNNVDCGAIKDDETRQTATGIEIRIAGEWCPVLSTHLLTRGKSPGR